ncbi:ferredoxin [Streptomyces sp. AA0539]|uniref:ferredoxin n=1 Tax=Streptomyces sp. AA0539 TaxID=1210045 RepID=UPI003FCF7A11
MDRAACVGAGQCQLLAPEVFDQDDTGVVVLRPGHLTAEAVTAASAAVDLCPVGAITFHPDDDRAPGAERTRRRHTWGQ